MRVGCGVGATGSSDGAVVVMVGFSVAVGSSLLFLDAVAFLWKGPLDHVPVASSGTDVGTWREVVTGKIFVGTGNVREGAIVNDDWLVNGPR